MSIVVRRTAIALGATFMVVVLGIAALSAAWLAGVHVPLASGATYMQVQKLASADAAGTPTGTFFIALIGSDARPGIAGARGDALHLVGINPSTNVATMLNIPRDTCWRGGKINRALAESGPAAQAQALSELIGVPVSYSAVVDFAGFRGIVDGMGGVVLDVPFEMHDGGSGAFFRPGVQRLNGDQALAYSRNRKQFPNSDITRTANQGFLILSALAQLQQEAKGPFGEFKAAALLGRHAQLEGMGLTDIYRLGRIAHRLDPAQMRELTIPTSGGGCLGLSSAAGPLFADFADDAMLQSH